VKWWTWMLLGAVVAVVLYLVGWQAAALLLGAGGAAEASRRIKGKPDPVEPTTVADDLDVEIDEAHQEESDPSDGDLVDDLNEELER